LELTTVRISRPRRAPPASSRGFRLAIADRVALRLADSPALTVANSPMRPPLVAASIGVASVDGAVIFTARYVRPSFARRVEATMASLGH